MFQGYVYNLVSCGYNMYLKDVTRLLMIFCCTNTRPTLDVVAHHVHQQRQKAFRWCDASFVVGPIMSCRVMCLQTGYNLLYGCWKYSWDADCELFLKILRGEVREEVYVEQIQLQVISRHIEPHLVPNHTDTTYTRDLFQTAMSSSGTYASLGWETALLCMRV